MSWLSTTTREAALQTITELLAIGMRQGTTLLIRGFVPLRPRAAERIGVAETDDFFADRKRRPRP